MYAHRVEATLNQEGALVLTNLPFHAGEAVEVIVLPRSNVIKETPNKYAHDAPHSLT